MFYLSVVEVPWTPDSFKSAFYCWSHCDCESGSKNRSAAQWDTTDVMGWSAETEDLNVFIFFWRFLVQLTEWNSAPPPLKGQNVACYGSHSHIFSDVQTIWFCLLRLFAHVQKAASSNQESPQEVEPQWCDQGLVLPCRRIIKGEAQRFFTLFVFFAQFKRISNTRKCVLFWGRMTVNSCCSFLGRWSDEVFLSLKWTFYLLLLLLLLLSTLWSERKESGSVGESRSQRGWPAARSRRREREGKKRKRLVEKCRSKANYVVWQVGLISRYFAESNTDLPQHARPPRDARAPCDRLGCCLFEYSHTFTPVNFTAFRKRKRKRAQSPKRLWSSRQQGVAFGKTCPTTHFILIGCLL